MRYPLAADADADDNDARRLVAILKTDADDFGRLSRRAPSKEGVCVMLSHSGANKFAVHTYSKFSYKLYFV
jgi:CRISPR/Cas system-associated protein Cas10 (large subunit of type III CRISPR-Cas system)